MAYILCYCIEFGSFEANCVQAVMGINYSKSSLTRPVCKGGVTGVVIPPKFIRSKIFWVNLWQLYYSDSTVRPT